MCCWRTESGAIAIVTNQRCSSGMTTACFLVSTPWNGTEPWLWTRGGIDGNRGHVDLTQGHLVSHPRAFYFFGRDDWSFYYVFSLIKTQIILFDISCTEKSSCFMQSKYFMLLLRAYLVRLLAPKHGSYLLHHLCELPMKWLNMTACPEWHLICLLRRNHISFTFWDMGLREMVFMNFTGIWCTIFLIALPAQKIRYWDVWNKRRDSPKMLKVESMVTWTIK